MTTMEATAKYRFIGTTDECTECGLCGKMQLRSTVVLMPLDEDGNDEGEVVYFGSTCAAKVLGRTGRGQGARVLAEARGAHWRTLAEAEDAHRMLAHYGLPETGDVDGATLAKATARYIHQHRNAIWASEKTFAQWRDMVLDMLSRKRAALTAAALIGA